MHKITKIVALNWIDRTSRSAIIPGYTNKKKTRKLKELTKSKGNCYFSSGISKSLIDFIYRAVTRLKLKDRKLIFTKGAVKINNKTRYNAVGITELEWDVGTSIRIPAGLNYNNRIHIAIDSEEYELRLMELIVLAALIHIAFPRKKSKWCTEMSALIIVRGWRQFERMNPDTSDN